MCDLSGLLIYTGDVVLDTPSNGSDYASLSTILHELLLHFLIVPSPLYLSSLSCHLHDVQSIHDPHYSQHREL